MKTFNVEKLSLGDKTLGRGDEIIFKTVEDLQEARTEVENGKDLYVMQDGVITALPYRMIYQKIYDGTIRMSAVTKEGTC